MNVFQMVIHFYFSWETHIHINYLYIRIQVMKLHIYVYVYISIAGTILLVVYFQFFQKMCVYIEYLRIHKLDIYKISYINL